MPYVYILRCNDGTLYTGYTTCMERRIEEHRQGLASKYTRGRRPVECVYVEELESKSEALKKEFAIKKMNRLQKERLIKENLALSGLIHKSKDGGKNNSNKKC